MKQPVTFDDVLAEEEEFLAREAFMSSEEWNLSSPQGS
jgi:hypothetical protein